MHVFLRFSSVTLKRFRTNALTTNGKREIRVHCFKFKKNEYKDENSAK